MAQAQLQSLMMIGGWLLGLLLSAAAMAIWAACCSEETLRALAISERETMAVAGIFGSAWAWNLGTMAVGASSSSALVAYFGPVVIARGLILLVIMPALVALSYAAWKAGRAGVQAALREASDTPPHWAMMVRMLASWVWGLPLALVVIPCSIASPITIPLVAMVTIPLAVYGTSRSLPFTV